MVTLKEYSASPENAIFVHKDTKFGQPKTIMRFKLNQILSQYAATIKSKGGDPTSREFKLYMADLYAETLEHFDIEIPKESEQQPPAKLKSKDGKGEFCYKCGLQKEDTKIIEEGDKVMRVCQECQGI